MLPWETRIKVVVHTAGPPRGKPHSFWRIFSSALRMRSLLCRWPQKGPGCQRALSEQQHKKASWAFTSRSCSLESQFLGGGSLDSTSHIEESLVLRKKKSSKVIKNLHWSYKAKAQRPQAYEAEQRLRTSHGRSAIKPRKGDYFLVSYILW